MLSVNRRLVKKPSEAEKLMAFSLTKERSKIEITLTEDDDQTDVVGPDAITWDLAPLIAA